MNSMTAFRKVYFPGAFVADHSLLFVEGTWHLFHICFKEGGDEWDRVIGHATSPDLLHWRREEGILPKAPPPSWESCNGGNAPHVFPWDGKYYLFYSRYQYPHTRFELQQIGLATSEDLFSWTKHEGNPIFHPSPRWCPWEDEQSDQYRPGCCRDPHVTRIGDRFVMYYVAMTRKHRISAVACAVSADLVHWDDLGPVAGMPVTDDGTGMCESPCVVSDGERWLLFFKHGRGTRYAVSHTPFAFNESRQFVESHASEVFDWDGRWYITHCAPDGLYLAEIDLHDDPPRVLPLGPAS